MESTELARLRQVAGKQTTRLTHYGRKTGKPHEVTIWFVLDGDRLYIGTANVNRQWVQNVQKTPQVKLSIAGENVEGTARFLTNRAEHERAMAAIRRKYWIFRPIIELGRFLAASRMVSGSPLLSGTEAGQKNPLQRLDEVHLVLEEEIWLLILMASANAGTSLSNRVI